MSLVRYMEYNAIDGLLKGAQRLTERIGEFAGRVRGAR